MAILGGLTYWDRRTKSRKPTPTKPQPMATNIPRHMVTCSVRTNTLEKGSVICTTLMLCVFVVLFVWVAAATAPLVIVGATLRPSSRGRGFPGPHVLPELRGLCAVRGGLGLAPCEATQPT
jgi:hypothetical protein